MIYSPFCKNFAFAIATVMGRSDGLLIFLKKKTKKKKLKTFLFLVNLEWEASQLSNLRPPRASFQLLFQLFLLMFAADVENVAPFLCSKLMNFPCFLIVFKKAALFRLHFCSVLRLTNDLMISQKMAPF